MGRTSSLLSSLPTSVGGGLNNANKAKLKLSDGAQKINNKINLTKSVSNTTARMYQYSHIGLLFRRPDPH